MKSRQIWIVAGTAVVSFALGLIVAPSLRRPDTASVAAIHQTKSNGRSSSGTESGDAEEFSGKVRAGTRTEKKKAGELRIAVPLQSLEKAIKSLHPIDAFDNFSGMKIALNILGASEEQIDEIMALLDRSKSEIHAEEKNRLKAIQVDETKIRLDTRAMEAPAKAIVQRMQNDIRMILPPDTADILVSSTEWNSYYSTEERFFPTLTVNRQAAGWLRGSENGKTWERRFRIDSQFADDGTPIPADEIFDDRWKPFLKGLTLLPQNEK